MPRHKHPEFERAARRMRKAAQEIADAGLHELVDAVKRFGHAQNEWHNAIPRDHMMRPVPGVLG